MTEYDVCAKKVREVLELLFETDEGQKFWGVFANHTYDSMPAFLDGASIVCSIWNLDIPGVIEFYNLWAEYGNIFINVIRRRAYEDI